MNTQMFDAYKIAAEVVFNNLVPVETAELASDCVAFIACDPPVSEKAKNVALEGVARELLNSTRKTGQERFLRQLAARIEPMVQDADAHTVEDHKKAQSGELLRDKQAHARIGGLVMAAVKNRAQKTLKAG